MTLENKYSAALNLLHSSDKFRICLGLERISKVLKLCNNPEKNLKFIHVAGTNGKGSVCAILDECLRQAGFNVGLYTSPHIFDYTERIKLNGKMIDKSEFAELVLFVCNLAEKNKIFLTEFEILTTVMFIYYSKLSPDYVVMETGLGGRLDATNVIENCVCAVITHIDFDHTERLGSTLEKIALEKYGILKPDCPFLTHENFDSLNKKAKINNSKLLPIFNSNKLLDNLALKGCYQKENLDLAYSVLKNCFPEISDKTISIALKKVKHYGRFDYRKEQNIIFDAAHNPNGAAALKKSLDEFFPKSMFNRRFIFGCLKNKDYKSMINTLFEKDDEILFYHFNHQNSCTWHDLAKACPYKTSEFNFQHSVTTDKLTVICGSIYMLAEFYNHIFVTSD